MQDQSTPLLSVIKRDGRKEVLDIDKIRRVIARATQGLDNVSNIKLETAISELAVEGMTTRSIQSTLILKALSFLSLDEPDWRYVAGRLVLMDHFKEVKLKRTGHYTKFYDYLQSQVKEGIYAKDVLEVFSPELVTELGEYIKPVRDDDYDYAGAIVLVNRYLAPNELPQEMYMTLAILLSDKNIQRAKDIYDAISLRKISLATPILKNLRRTFGCTASCFVQVVDDSLDSIFNAVKDVAMISAASGGVGLNLSRIRAEGAPLRNMPNASHGVVPWIRIFNDTAVAVDQGGTRAGAVTISLDIWHKDIEQFLELQTEAGDQRSKAYDIFPQVVIPDLFMERVKANGNWTLVDPHEVQSLYGVCIAEKVDKDFSEFYTNLEQDKLLTRTKVVKARQLFKSILKCLVETGLPYLAFKDAMNRQNPNPDYGIIASANLCVESYSVTVPDQYTHICSLCSINLANTDLTELESITKLCVEILDYTIDISKPPTEEAIAHNNMFRVIGVGTMGLADWLAKYQLVYKEAKAEVNDLYERIAYYAALASINLARYKGAFKAYPSSTWARGQVYSRPYEWYKKHGRLDWDVIFNFIDDFGIRNSQILAIAPNSTTSLLQGCVASIMPPYGHFYRDKNGIGKFPLMPQYIKEARWYYPQNQYLDQRQVIDMTITIQKWVDTGISMELLYNFDLPEPPTAKTIYEDYLHAWESGLKTVYYIRPNAKKGSTALQSSSSECTSCAN